MRRLRRGLGLPEEAGMPVVVVGGGDVVVVKEEEGFSGGELVSLKSVLLGKDVTGGMAQACRRVALELKRRGVPVFRRKKVAHVRRKDVLRVVEVVVGV